MSETESIQERPPKRHFLSTRLWHWISLISVIVLFMSGLNISNAHRFLYWGDWGFAPEHAWLEVPRFPGWMTIPNFYSLAKARDWHLLMAIPFAFALLGMWIAMLRNGHFWRDIRTGRDDWRPQAIWHDIREHLKLNFEHGDGKYNFLQKASYGLVLGILLPGMVLTGMAISPGLNAAFPLLVDLMGGRQSARSIHFIFAWAIFGFFVVHLTLVIVAGPLGQIRSMITGAPLDETRAWPFGAPKLKAESKPTDTTGPNDTTGDAA